MNYITILLHKAFAFQVTQWFEATKDAIFLSRYVIQQSNYN